MKPLWRRRPDILLCPNVPKPLHQVAPRNILGSSWWNTTRKEAYARTRERCMACGVHKRRAKRHQWLEGHELYDIDYKRGRMTYIETVPLCHYCHNYIHDGRLRALLEQGQIQHHKFVAILQHGDEILREAGLVRTPFEERQYEYVMKTAFNQTVTWRDWRLVLYGKEYPPKFVSLEAYETYWKTQAQEKSYD